jgi:ribosomal protein S18 acetylase RimI-like enzyme
MKQSGTGNKASINILTREFRIEDYDALVNLWKGTGLPYKPQGRDRRDKIEGEIRRANAIFLVAEVDGKLVGSVLATHDGRKGWINRLAVAPAFRFRGIAKRLVAEAESRLSSQGIEIVACLIEDWNIDSKRFFETIGYNRFDEISYFTKKKRPDV